MQLCTLCKECHNAAHGFKNSTKDTANSDADSDIFGLLDDLE
jgi:hypothetical protein